MKKFTFTLIAQLLAIFVFAQTVVPVPMASQGSLTYSESFSTISTWTFSTGGTFSTPANAKAWQGLAAVGTTGIPNGTTLTTATQAFATGTSGGFQKGTNAAVLLTTGSTDNTAADAVDFFMDFTGVNAGTLTLDAATVFNSTGDRAATLHVYYSTNGTTFTELTGTNLPYVATNNVTGSATGITVNLPAAFNNVSTARLRFYCNNGTGGTTGSRAKVSFTNVKVTATSMAASPTHYAVTTINPNPAIAGSAFSVTVVAEDASNNPTNAGSASNFTLSTNGNAGTIGGPITGTIASGSNTVTVSGVTLSTAGNGATITATNTSGLSLTAGTSATFNVLAAAPTTQALNIAFANVTISGFDISWTSGNGTNRLVVVRPATATNVAPVNGTGYSAALNIGSAGTTGTNNYVVYAGAGSGPITVAGLTAGVNYSVEVYEFKGSTTTSNYLTTTATLNPNTQQTASPPYYWNGANPTAGSSVTANGGTGTWTTTNAWVIPSSPGTGATWADGNAAIVAGTAGTIAITSGLTETPTSTTFNTTGYTLTASSTSTSTLGGTIVLANGVNLNLNDATATGNRTLATGSISGGTGSGITLGGAQTSGNMNRLNLTQGNATISVPVTIVGTGSATAYAGIVGTATGTSVTGNITNNGTQPTVVGATSAGTLTVSGNITGTAPVLIAGGTSGGGGTLTLSGINTYSGVTNVNNLSTGLIKCGATNTLSPNSTLNLGFSNTNGGIVDLNGFDQTIPALSSGVGTGSITNGATGTGTNTLTINQSTATTFALNITDGATAKTAVVKSGAGTLTLSGANTFTGGLTVTAGTVLAGATNALAATPVVLNGGKLSTGTGAGFAQSLGALQLTANSTIALGSGVYSLLFTNSSAQTWTAGKTLTITGWAGQGSTSGTAGKIFVGSNASGLTTAQLAQISFTGFLPGATQLTTGEVVPTAGNLVVDQTGFNGAFGNITLGSSSAEQTFVVSGANLNSTVVINPPTGYQVSLTTGTGFQTTNITLNTTLGNLTNTTIYVKYVPALRAAQNGNIAVSSGSALQNVAVTGTGVLTTVYAVGNGKVSTDLIWSPTTTGAGQTIAALGGFDSTLNIVVQSGFTVTTNVSMEITAKNITINSGGVLKELHGSGAAPYYMNLYGDLTVDGQLGALNGGDSLGLNVEGANDLIQGAGTINLQRLRKSANTNIITNLTVAANVDLWWAQTALYNNFSGTTTFNVTINNGATVNLHGVGDIAMDATNGNGTGQRTGIITVNGTLTGVDSIYAFTNNNAAGLIGFSIGSGGLISANRVMAGIGGTGTFTFNVQTGGKLDIYTALELQSGTFAPNGTVTFKSTSVSNVAYLDNFSAGFTGTYAGQMSAERYYDASATYDQHYMGTPVNAPALSQFGVSGTPGFVTPTGNCDETQLSHTSGYGTVFSMHESNGGTCSLAQWKVETTGNALNGIGYSVLKSNTGTLTLTGGANLNSSYTLSGLSNTGWTNTSHQGHSYHAGWQLVSNPYLATLNITAANSGFDSQVQVWNANGPYAGTYQTSNIIAPFQAFMVHKTNAGTGGTFIINATDRVVTAHTFYAQNANQLNIVAANTTTGLLDQTTVGFDAAATDSFDTQIDAEKIPGALNRHTIYSANNGSWLSKNEMHSIATTNAVEVGFEPGATGTYTLTFNGVNTFDPTSYITLEDKLLNTFTDVRNGPYTFTADSADNWSRFVLHFTPATVVNTVNPTCTSTGTIQIQQPGPANWNYVLADANNAIVASGVLNQSQPVNVNAANGTYTLTLIDANNYTATKIISIAGAEPIVAAFNTSENTIQANEGAALNSTTIGAVSYNWNFGNGTTANGQTTTVLYTAPGVYTVQLTVSNASGCSASTTKTITVTAAEATGITTTTTNTSPAIYSHDNKVFADFTQMQNVDATVTIYNILGQTLSSEHCTNTNVYQKEIDYIDAAYLVVAVRSNAGIITKKVFITNSK